MKTEYMAISISPDRRAGCLDAGKLTFAPLPPNLQTLFRLPGMLPGQPLMPANLAFRIPRPPGAQVDVEVIRHQEQLAIHALSEAAHIFHSAKVDKGTLNFLDTDSSVLPIRKRRTAASLKSLL